MTGRPIRAGDVRQSTPRPTHHSAITNFTIQNSKEER